MNFFQELEKLKDKMPRLSSIILTSVNSDYNYAVENQKNCYLLANAVNNEDCMYGRDIYGSADCVDCGHIRKCTLCYECLNCSNCYDSSYLQDCEDSQNCDFGYDVKGCKNCIGCVGLRKKEFHIFNEPYSKEDFSAKKKLLKQDEIKPRFEELKTKVPRKFAELIQVENCFGDYIYHSRNAYHAFDVVECQDIDYVVESKKLKDCYDITILENSELCYDISSSHVLTNCNFCFQCTYSSDLEYCELVFNSRYCFGCISRNHAEYEILNEKYSRDEYFKKVREIKEQLKREETYGRQYLTPTYPVTDSVVSWLRM